MPQLAPERVPLGAYVDREQKAAVRELAQRSDRSVSSIVRRALTRELERSGGDSSPHPPRAGLSDSEGPATGGEE